MRGIITHVIHLHWAVVFSALALVCALDPEAGLRAPLGLLGLASDSAEPEPALAVAAFLGSGFLMAAILHLWALLSGLAGEGNAADTSTLALAVTVLMLTLLFALSAFARVEGLVATEAALMTATLASCLVIGAKDERRDDEPISLSGATARMMATDAVQTASLFRQPALPVKPGREN